MNKIQIIHKTMWKMRLAALSGGLFLLLGLSHPTLALEKMAPSTDAASDTSDTAATAPANSENSLASEAGNDFKGGGKSLGSGFKKGAQVTGGAFKKAGVTVGHAFKKAGTAIKEFFVGKKETSVEEKDLSETSEPAGEDKPEPAAYDRNLDTVGDS